MPSSNVEVIEIGIPGPPGAGVSSAEKASFVTLSGANTFTNTNTIHKNSTAALTVEKEDGTDVLVVDTTNKEAELQNGTKLRGYSDANTTETFSIDAATGDIQTDGNLTVDGGSIKGEQLWLAFMIDGGGSTITTGTKVRWQIPYNCQLISDGTSFWNVVLDQSGSISLDLWVDTYANYPPTNADRISGTLGSNNPRVSAATKAQSATTTNWTLTLAKGSYLFIDVNSVSTATFCTLSLHVKKT